MKKCVTDITEIKAKDGKLYVSAIFDCYDLMPNGLAMADHMRAELCCETLKTASLRYPEIRGAIVHSDRGSQYTSAAYQGCYPKIRHCPEHEQCQEEDAMIMQDAKAYGQE